ncbi:MAG TPA: RDD family protein, partial [Thermomicrobiaceae bacterium]|nr:RDD family protein [Thermomicrobiaceae bacterium]
FFFAPAWSDSNYEDLATLIWLIVPWLYYALMESSPYQATLGKLAAGIVVTDEFGGRISFGRASGRYFAKWISYLTFFIGFVVAGFTKQKQALHDLIAGTLVTVNSQTQ